MDNGILNSAKFYKDLVNKLFKIGLAILSTKKLKVFLNDKTQLTANSAIPLYEIISLMERSFQSKVIES